jgi:hypothetical protein
MINKRLRPAVLCDVIGAVAEFMVSRGGCLSYYDGMAWYGKVSRGRGGQGAGGCGG